MLVYQVSLLEPPSHLPLHPTPIGGHRSPVGVPQLESYVKFPLAVYLHMLVYIFPSYSLHSSHFLLPTHCWGYLDRCRIVSIWPPRSSPPFSFVSLSTEWISWSSWWQTMYRSDGRTEALPQACGWQWPSSLPRTFPDLCSLPLCPFQAGSIGSSLRLKVPHALLSHLTLPFLGKQNICWNLSSDLPENTKCFLLGPWLIL